jgi:hypothetical protein
MDLDLGKVKVLMINTSSKILEAILKTYIGTENIGYPLLLGLGGTPVDICSHGMTSSLLQLRVWAPVGRYRTPTCAIRTSDQRRFSVATCPSHHG